MSPLRILLADPCPAFLDSARYFLTAQTGVRVVGQVQSAANIVAEALRRQPEVVLVSPYLPERQGLEAAIQLKLVAPTMRIVLLSDYSDPPYLELAVEFQLDGCLIKADFCSSVAPLLASLSAAGETGRPAERIHKHSLKRAKTTFAGRRLTT